MTGAPKVAALEVIAELESAAREVYTGAIGFVSPLAGLELSVAIRTFEFSGEDVWLGVGGGIVADSEPARRARRMRDEARAVARGDRQARLEADLPGGPVDGVSTVRQGAPLPARLGRPPGAATGPAGRGLRDDARPRRGLVAVELPPGTAGSSVEALYGLRLPVDAAGLLAAAAAGERAERPGCG